MRKWIRLWPDETRAGEGQPSIDEHEVSVIGVLFISNCVGDGDCVAAYPNI